jgi:predicted secreted Zn-dependent protease
MRLLSAAGVAAGLLFLIPNVAAAKPAFTTKYVYYNVSGDSASELYNAMLRRGPHVNGSKAYASTSATSSQEGRLAQGKSCQIQNYRFKIDFVIKLPKLKNEGALTGATRSNWQKFSQFLRNHEETHRSIWLGCAQDLENRIRAIKSKDCGSVDAKAAKLWDSVRAACNKKHDAFDAAEQRRLIKHPFVRLVLNQKGKSTSAAALKMKKKKKNSGS